MKCPSCANEMIKTRVSRYLDEYDYCRTCKKELKELQPVPGLSPAVLQWNVDQVMSIFGGSGGTYAFPTSPITAYPTPNPAALNVPRNNLPIHTTHTGERYRVVHYRPPLCTFDAGTLEILHEFTVGNFQCNCASLTLHHPAA